MDAKKAVELLSSGAEGIARWNQLRVSAAAVPTRLVFNAEFEINDRVLDLSGADLGGCSLKGSNLYGATFAGAHLYRADLSDVSLHRARLTGAYLFEADLSRAKLKDADFSRCDLREACLREARGPANFNMARMERANLRKGNFDDSDFSGANLADADLEDISASGAYFASANMQYANLRRASLFSPGGRRGVRKTRLDHADLTAAIASQADFSGAVLRGANLSSADFSHATLVDADLEQAHLIHTDLQGAALCGASVYGISAWDLLTDAKTVQENLGISRSGETPITVDDLQIAQFMHLLLDNSCLRRVIDSITSKVVLILGRFTVERKPVLDALRQALRGSQFDLVPVVFDFSRPVSRTTAVLPSVTVGLRWQNRLAPSELGTF
jgi:uncharacterized protein YjbI with pentapeptide repeats